MFLTNFNSSVEFAICWGISFTGGSYYMESSTSICNINPLTGFCMVGDFSGCYSQTDRNFNINVNVTVSVSILISDFHIYWNIYFLLRLWNLKVLAKLQQYLYNWDNTSMLAFFSLFFYIYLKNERDMSLTYFLIAFICLYSLTGSSSPGFTFIKLTACN